MIPEELYKEIIKVMPIPCVDLLVRDSDGRILLVKRKNPPAQGQWWFPGGRVLYFETRKDAAIRKLWEECGLKSLDLWEIGTYDLLFDECGSTSHGITTLFVINVKYTKVILDGQASVYQWNDPQECLEYVKHPFLVESISRMINLSL